MTMSLSFSAILYGVSAQQLDRQISVTEYIDEAGEFGPMPRVEQYLKGRIESSKANLIINISVLNAVMLVFGGAISYLLARRTLAPIEESIAAQARFVSDASHELRTPLTSLRLTNEIAARDPRMSLKEARELIASNLEEVIRLQNLSNLLLGFLTSDELVAKRETISLEQITKQAAHIVEPQSDKKFITVTIKADEATTIAGSKELITQALVAVLDNAIKYSPEHSTVTISETTTKRQVSLFIADQGPGINQAELDKIFQRFYRSDQARTRSEQSGFGLGLSIAKQLIEAHEGRVSVKSKEGQGSVFCIRLPRS